MLENLLVYLTILSPIIAFAIWNIRLNGKKWCIVTIFLSLIATIYLAFHPPNIENVSYWLPYYTLFLMIYIMLLIPKYGTKQFNKILALAIFMLFIAGEWWELPVFVYDFIGKGGVADVGWWFSHVRRVYTLATFLLFTKLAQTHFRKPTIIATAVFGSWLFALMLLPTTIAFYPFLPTITRLLGMYLFGVMTVAAL